MGVIMHKNVSYGGGSVVEPNPQESATEQLETLGIDGDVYEVTDANAIHTSDVGVANGVAELDANGKVPSSQLPSYVDDVLEYASRSAFPATGETGKIYVALDTNLTYRWGGSDYVEISPSLALGETSSTAYRGDRGKIAYDHSQSDHSGIKPAFTEASTRANIASGESFATILGKIKKFFSDLKTVAFSGSYNDLTNKPTIPAAQVNSDWDASSGVAQILHKPALATVATSGSYNDLSNKPTIPTVNNGTLTIQKNGTQVATFSANQSGNATANIECAVPSDVEGSKVATGNPLTITDAAGIKAEKIVIEFEPKQAGSGTPSPSNIRPITGYTSLSANRCGKNLWGYGNVTFTGYNKEVEITRKLTGSFSMSLTVTSNDTDASTCAMIIYYKSGSASATYQWARGSRQAKTFNIGDNVVDKIRFYSSDNYNHSAGDTATWSDIMLEEGSSPSPYDQFKGDNVTIQLGQTLYGGKLTILQDGSADVDVDTGFDVFDGSDDENWGKYNSGSASAYAMQITLSNLIVVSDDDNKVNIIANELESVAYNDTWGDYNAFVCKNTNIETRTLVAGVRTITTVADWKSYLASNPLQVAYKLANPFTIHLSPVEPLTLLQGINNVWTDGTTLSLTYQPDNAIGQAKGTAQEAMAIANGLKPLYSTGSVGSGKTGSQIIAEITLPEAGTYYITGWARFTGNGKKAVWLWCEGSLSESWEDSTISTAEPKTFSTFAIYTASAAGKVVQVDSYTVSASNAVTGGIVAFKIS